MKIQKNPDPGAPGAQDFPVVLRALQGALQHHAHAGAEGVTAGTAFAELRDHADALLVASPKNRRKIVKTQGELRKMMVLMGFNWFKHQVGPKMLGFTKKTLCFCGV